MIFQFILIGQAILCSLNSVILNTSDQTPFIQHDILTVYVSILSSKPEFNTSWIEEFISRVTPVHQTHPVTSLLISLSDQDTIQVILFTIEYCKISTAKNVKIPNLLSNTSNKDDSLLLAFTEEILFHRKMYYDILSIFNLTKPSFSALVVSAQTNVNMEINQAERFIQKFNNTINFNSIIFIINESSLFHNSKYGSPYYEHTYSDGTGFNEALTLRNIPLIYHSTLQYVLLINGICTRVAGFQQLETANTSLYTLLHHFFTDYFISNDLFVYKHKSNHPKDSLLSADYQRSECEDDILNQFKIPLLEKIEWNKSDTSFADFLFAKTTPIVLTNTCVSDWEAIKSFTFENISYFLNKTTYHEVKKTKSKLTFDPDFKGVKLNLNLTLPYQKVTLNNSELFSSFTQDSSHGHYLFTHIDIPTLSYFSPSDMLFRTYDDWLSRKQFLWVSSSGLATHTHIDMDWNCFVQIRGRKKFTLFPTSQHLLMHMYPRVHPMWHKSRVDLDHFSDKFSTFRLTTPIQVTLNPGDLLFIPGYTWHYVESLTDSISVSTWSHDYDLLAHMDAVYNHDHKFDLLYHKEETFLGKIAALRIYIDMLINKMVGVGRTKQFLGQLISSRYSSLEALFTFDFPSTLCDAFIIPTAHHIVGYARLDTEIVSQHLFSLLPTSRDILLMSYMEEISAGVVGTEHLYDFFTSCFSNQTYHITNIHQDIDLWKHS